jgi:hypothetical protein
MRVELILLNSVVDEALEKGELGGLFLLVGDDIGRELKVGATTGLARDVDDRVVASWAITEPPE